MCSSRECAVLILLCCGVALGAQAQTARDAITPTAAATTATTAAAAAKPQAFVSIGRPATPQEIAAWDIDVRPDFKGLPKGQGSVAQGQTVWEAKCASCHGIFGESNEVFSPIVGGTTAADVTTGHVARLNDASFPGRTTLMKLPTLSTLWDYIWRAMPWNEPKSLSVNEVYAVTAYVLNLGSVLPDDFVLSDQTITQAQARLPNRNGMSTAHALWPGDGFEQRPPDVMAKACMKDCAGAGPIAAPMGSRVVSQLPDFVRNAHGNLAQQNRLVGAQRGVDTSPAASKPAANSAVGGAANNVANNVANSAVSTTGLALAQKQGCAACHGVDNKIVGPSFREIAAKHASRADALAYLATKAQAGGGGLWGAIAMPAQSLGDADAKAIAQWLLDGAKP
jgi:S-disulfanyl-L-cysteine oxidoreductase SoxD